MHAKKKSNPSENEENKFLSQLADELKCICILAVLGRSSLLGAKHKHHHVCVIVISSVFHIVFEHDGYIIRLRGSLVLNFNLFFY
jgi:hypothetical protein